MFKALLGYKGKNSPSVEKSIDQENKDREKEVTHLLNTLNKSLNTLDKILDNAPGELFQEEKNTIKEIRDSITWILENTQSLSSLKAHHLLNMNLREAQRILPRHIANANSLLETIEPINFLTLLENIKNLAEKTYSMIKSCSSAMDWVDEQHTPAVGYVTKLISYQLPENLTEQFTKELNECTEKYKSIMALLGSVEKHINIFLEKPQQIYVQAKNLEKELNFLIQEELTPLNDSIQELKEKIIKECPTAQINATEKEESILGYLAPLKCNQALLELSAKCKKLITQKPSSRKSKALTSENNSLILPESEHQENHRSIIYAELDFSNNNPPAPPTKSTLLSTQKSKNQEPIYAVVNKNRTPVKKPTDNLASHGQVAALLAGFPKNHDPSGPICSGSYPERDSDMNPTGVCQGSW